MKVAVLLSGCGVYDGAEIHESVLTLLALDRQGVAYHCIAPDVAQHHVINHRNGEEMNESRNVLTEASRIARGDISSLTEFDPASVDALLIPGGFGVAKNFTKWAFSGPEGDILPEVRDLIQHFVNAGKPIAALCMAPTTVAKALEGTAHRAKLTVGNTTESSPYEIEAISQGINATGAEAVMCNKTDVVVDDALNLITTPCYMMEARISEIAEGIDKAVAKLVEKLKG